MKQMQYRLDMVRISVLLASCMMIYACNDDASGGSVSGSTEDGSSSGSTQEQPDSGTACTSSADCGTNKICKDNQCIDKPVQDTAECKEDSDCGQRQVCRNSICESAAYQGDYCNDSMICLNDTLCIDNICSVYVDVGHDCIAGYACREGFVCNRRAVCTVPSALGEACDNFERVCAPGAYCDAESNTCVKGGNVGDKCDPAENLGCETGTVCRDGVCRQIAVLGQNCSESIVCFSETASCYDGECRELGHCTSDNECSADTYCCIEDGCSVRNVCLPYGEGPRPAVNEQCVYETVPGLFEADIQCEWPDPNVPETVEPSRRSIVTPAFVAKTPHDMGASNAVIFVTYKRGDWSGSDEAYHNGVIRIMNPESCRVVESIYDTANPVSAGAAIAVGDVDKDGFAEIFAQIGYISGDTSVQTGGIVSFHWDTEAKKYKTWKVQRGTAEKNLGWGGLSLHDINDDGQAEAVLPRGEVLDAQTLSPLNPKQTVGSSPQFALVEDIDDDGRIEYIAASGDVYEWEIIKKDDKIESQKWVKEYAVPTDEGGFMLKAVGDFGTPGASPSEFDWTKLDGKAEIVSTDGISKGKGQARLAIHALTSVTGEDGKTVKGMQRIHYQSGLFGGGAPTIGDFDGDTLPEVGVAFGDYYAVIDTRCVKDKDGKLPEGCISDNYLWKQKNVDNSSFTTGSAVFDFDGDGQIEIVYSDECYTRIYDGKTGDVLFSAKHSSRTAYEMPIIADVDNDQSAEILMGTNGMDRTCSTIDTIHRGIRCSSNLDCTSNVCEDNFCRCTASTECNWRRGADGKIKEEYECIAPLEADAAVNSKKVCRAKRPQNQTRDDLRIMRDRYDRWVSSRNLWNQYSYSINNINDDLTVPKLSEWIQNFLTPGLNNYRANAQGKIGRNAAPDITGKLNKDNLCVSSEGSITLTGMVCNRGTKMVASKMPASFYKVNEDGSIGEKYCTAYTSENVPVGGCLDVSCTVNASDIRNTKIRMISNDDGEGGRTTVECNDKNNADEIVLDACGVN